MDKENNIPDDLTNFHWGGAECGSSQQSEQDIHLERHQQCHAQRKEYRNVIKLVLSNQPTQTNRYD